jgi:hypothetical protein
LDSARHSTDERHTRNAAGAAFSALGEGCDDRDQVEGAS